LNSIHHGKTGKDPQKKYLKTRGASYGNATH